MNNAPTLLKRFAAPALPLAPKRTPREVLDSMRRTAVETEAQRVKRAEIAAWNAAVDAKRGRLCTS